MKKTLATLLLLTTLTACNQPTARQTTYKYLQQQEPDKELYMLMFHHIKQRAETHPEILDHFGPTATAYMEQKAVEKYLGAFELSIADTADSVAEQGRAAMDVFNHVKSYVGEHHGRP